MTKHTTPAKGTYNDGGALSPCETTNEKNLAGTAPTAPAASSDDTEQGNITTRPDYTIAAEYVTPQAHIETPVIEAQSARSKILAARKSPEKVAQLIATQTEQLSVPVYKRLPDGAFWRVRDDDDWDPKLSEVLLLPRKDGGGGPEFLLVLPELEALFQSDAKLRNLVRYYNLAFVADSRGRVGWWAVPSRSENDWHASARTGMRRLTVEWGMLKSDQGAKSYVLEKPNDDLGAPNWPAGSYDDWFVKGLSDKLIDTQDHPVLRELQGRK
jgi:hypothetical protein